MLNNISIMGRMVADPELKTTPAGTSVCAFTIACDRYAKAGEDKKADFIDIVAWRTTGEFVKRWFAKGDAIIITGSLQTRLWEDKAGNKRKSVEVIADTINFAGGKKNNNSSGNDFPFAEIEEEDGGNLPF